jgi:penicillin amidase
MNHALASRLRLLASMVSVLVLIAIAAIGWFYFELRRSLPQLDGTRALAGLSGTVEIARDGLGVPTVQAKSRIDAARALGFLHAQDRFFQMDLLRRRGAGELAELFGRLALPIDRATKPNRFRELARQVISSLPPDTRALLDAYTAGANTGLTALRSKPFEYFVLRVDPEPWKAEDSILIVYTMTLDLQDSTNGYERSLATARDHLGREVANFFAPLQTPNDAALDGSTAPTPPIPPAGVINLRANLTTATGRTDSSREQLAALLSTPARDGEFLPGSNSFALSGAHTANGSALLGNDPHLNLGVPNIWYRTVLEWPDASGSHRIVGVTLPGLPFVVLGSNEHIAWGLTDAYADTNDLVAVEVNPVSNSYYKIPGHDELMEIEVHHDSINVKGGAAEIIDTRWTQWGPIIGTDFRKRPLAHRWVAYDPAATNLNFIRLETARTAADAVAIAHDSGIPAHNFVVADRDGSIAWTIAGKFPKRVGFDGRLPTSWSFGDRRWDGYVAPANIPTILNPESGRLWTANNRIVGGTALALIGDGGYATPPRAAQIRDRLALIEHATPGDFLALQRDDRALFLGRWQKLLLATLTPEVVAVKASRSTLLHAAENWQGRASADSVSYRLVRAFRVATASLALEPVFASCYETMPDFSWRRFNYEPALWKLLEEKPLHFLPPTFANWDDLLVAAADRVVAQLDKEGIAVERATWGARNRAAISHPLGRALPGVLGSWLNLPADPLPGDADMPLIQNPSFGASMRMVVSPGHENEALFEMPGGQSGHPLSPYYRAGHQAWVRGEATLLLPGPAQHTLRLSP